MAKMAVVMGSKSDLDVVKSAISLLKSFGADMETLEFSVLAI